MGIFQNASGVGDFISRLPENIVNAGEKVIDFGSDIQQRINAIGRDFAQNQANQTVRVRGAEIGKNVGVFVSENIGFITAIFAITAIFLIQGKK